MVLTETIAGLGAIKTAFDMTKALKDINDATIRNGAVIELQEKILAAQEAQFELVKRVDTLEKEIASLEARQNKMQRYSLKDYGGSTFAYELKESEANGEPIHRVCPTCYPKGILSILQFTGKSEGQDWYECPTCDDRRGYGHHVHQSSYGRIHHTDF
jgi:formate dehydrogenase maturation protein FdhE